MVSCHVWYCYSSAASSCCTTRQSCNSHLTHSSTSCGSSAGHYGNSQLTTSEPVVLQPSTFHLVWYPFEFWCRYFTKPFVGKGTSLPISEFALFGGILLNLIFHCREKRGNMINSIIFCEQSVPNICHKKYKFCM